VSNYTPTHVGTITKYVFIESPRMTPGELALRAYEVSEGAMIKETCFGLQVTGSREQVDRIVLLISVPLIPAISLSRIAGSRRAMCGAAGRISAAHVLDFTAMSRSF
jgi:hypothetical protein